MNLGSLLTRAYDVLGDDPADPREFPRQPLIDAANRGCLVFRVMCHEVWRRGDLFVTAGVGEYTVPSEMLSLQRVAYDDLPLEARASNTLQSRDAFWLTKAGQPISWTNYGLPHNKFRLWPVPNQSTDEPFDFIGDTQVVFNGNPVTWPSNRGVVVRYQETGGANYTLSIDPGYVPGPAWSNQRGLTVQLSSAGFNGDYGEIGYVAISENNQLTLWATERPDTLTDDSQEIPVRKAWHIAILYFVLWSAYEEEGDHHNGILASWYRDQFYDQVQRCVEKVGNPVATQSTKLRGGDTSEAGEIMYGDVIVNGVPISVTW